ncbi:hypothetical protein J4434_05475 [Candidatus Woesearchaeota archaeon]|nr:hypothetical protein [Candidatus Woesearchaeota archaeon]
MKRKNLDIVKDWLYKVDDNLVNTVNHLDAEFYVRFPRTYRLVELICNVPLRAIERFASIGLKKSNDGKAAQEKTQHQEQREEQQVKQPHEVSELPYSAVSNPKYDLDTIIEREGMEGLSRAFNGLNITGINATNEPTLFSYISERDLQYAAERYTTAKINHALHFLGIDSLFESDNPLFVGETPKQKFARREVFIKILNEGNVLLSNYVHYCKQCDKAFVTGENTMLEWKEVVNDVKIKAGIYKHPSTIKNKRILMHLLAFDYLLDIATYEHYLGLLEKAGKIRKKRDLNDGEDAEEETLIKGLTIEYTKALSQFVDDRQTMLQKETNLLNLVNSSLGAITKQYLDYLVGRYELVVEKYESFVRRDEPIGEKEVVENIRTSGVVYENISARTRSLEYPHQLLKSKEYPSMVQWVEERNFKGENKELIAVRIPQVLVPIFSVKLADAIVRTDYWLINNGDMPYYMGLGLLGMFCYLGVEFNVWFCKKANKTCKQTQEYYLQKNEPLIEKIIAKGISSFEGYHI